MQEIQYQLEDIGQTVRDNMEKIDFSPSRLEEVESRLDLISRLCKKYKVKDSAKLLEYKANAERELENINLSEEQIQKAKDDLARKQREYTEKAADLSNLRLEVARSLEQQMDEELADLAMERTRFHIKIEREEQEDSPVRIGGQGYKAFASGIDHVEFFIAAGEKETLRPLKKIASGGEMSRLMLSLKKIIIDKVEPQSMVFDEVDSGIGGKVAERVGQKLRGLSNKAQVVCITHLPQIAAMADIQFSVAKEEDEEGRVVTQLKRLTAKERQEEIARMLGGEKITELTREHAKELIELAQRMKDE
jgi:DNA repair protein RecN (Recombination protein N)